MRNPAKPSVLVVDDDLLARETLVALLRDDHDVTEVGSCAAARSALKSWPFDVVILDYELPDGNGGDLLAELDADSPASIAILVTGHGNDPTVLAFRNRGDLVLAKPFDPSVLLSYVREAVQLSKMRDANLRLRARLAGSLAS